jgi:hypothetical protein
MLENRHFGPMYVANARIWAILGVADARKWPKFVVFGIGPLIGIHTGPDGEKRRSRFGDVRRGLWLN